jgi:RimJ/RimL family protein N-acetyltransferase
VTSPTLEDSIAGERIAGPLFQPHIRIFQERDAEAVAEIFNDSEEGWPGGFMQGVHMTAERVLRRQQEQAPQATFIAWAGERAAGYCSFFEQPEERGSAGHIGLLNVATSFQGRGYGRDLLRAALAHAGALAELRVPAGEERHLLAFLVVARDEAEARAYRALADAEELP